MAPHKRPRVRMTRLNQANAIFNREAPGGKCVFIDERKAGIGSGFAEFANAEAQQNALFYPDVHAPLAIDLLCRANLALCKLLAKIEEDVARFRIALYSSSRSKPLNGRFEGMHEGESIKEPRMQKSE